MGSILCFPSYTHPVLDVNKLLLVSLDERHIDKNTNFLGSVMDLLLSNKE